MNTFKALSKLGLLAACPLLALGLLLASGGCAGYQIGMASLYPPDIHSVHVPVFANDTFRPYLGEQVTEAVIKEIEANTNFKVVDAASADSVLTGRVVAMRKRVLANERNDNPRDIETAFQVVAQWTDRRGAALLQQTTLAPAMFDVQITEASHFVPEGGQSVASSEQVAIQRVARQIVSQMNMPW